MIEYLYLTAILLAFSAYVFFENLEALCEGCRARRRRAEMKAASSAVADPTPIPPSVAEAVAAPSADADISPAPVSPSVEAAVATPKAAPSAPPAPKPTQERGTHLRDPATGEITAIPSNYRFAKKWVKEALVAEGLLDRIYKPGELDEATSRRVKEAIERLCLLDRYRP